MVQSTVDLKTAVESCINEIDSLSATISGGFITDSYTTRSDGLPYQPIVYPGTGTSVPIDTQYFNVVNTPAAAKCDHIMGDETELEDGQVSGFCVACGDKIKGRRMVGGYGLARLKDALVDALGDPHAMAELLDEIDRVELMLKVEEAAMRSAYDMIEMARKMVKTIVLPEED